MIHGGELIREARKRAGLTQQDLAEGLGTSQPVIARWESGATSPSVRRVVEAIRACGLDLSVRLVTFDDQHEVLIDRNLRLTPLGRLRQQVDTRAGIEKLLAAAGRPNDHLRS